MGGRKKKGNKRKKCRRQRRKKKWRSSSNFRQHWTHLLFAFFSNVPGVISDPVYREQIKGESKRLT